MTAAPFPTRPRRQVDGAVLLVALLGIAGSTWLAFVL